MKTLKIALIACGLITLNATAVMADWVACPKDDKFKWSLGDHEEGYSVWRGRINTLDPEYRPWDNMTVTFSENERSKITVYVAAMPHPGHLTCAYTAENSTDRFQYTHLSDNIPALRGKVCHPMLDPNTANWGFNCL